MRDIDTTEFFIRAMYEYFFGSEFLAAENIYYAALTLKVNSLYQKEVLDKLN